MLTSEPIGWWNTGLPMLVLGILAVVLPWVLARKAESQKQLVFWVFVSAILLTCVGMAIFAWASGGQVAAAYEAAPALTVLAFLRPSLFAGIIWGPVLVLTWFAMAQSVEARKGAALAEAQR